jgi:hypothetical protein
MHWKRLLVLVLLVGSLAVLATRFSSEPRGAGGTLVLSTPLFPGLEADRIERIEVDYVELGRTVAAVRLAPRSWRVVEPYEARALASLPEQLADLAQRAAGEEAVGFEAAAVGLESPGLRIRFEERIAGGERREHLLEMGDPDIDGLRSFARVEGRIVRVPRSFQSYLDLGVENWRDKRLLGVPRGDVLGFRRSGAIPDAAGRVEPRFAGELDLEIQLDERGWWVSAPFRARLSPAAVDPLRVVLGSFAGRAVLDAEGLRGAEFGLDPPAFSYTVELRDGSHPVLDFGRFADGADSSTWTVMRGRDDERREGGVIYAMLDSDARLLLQPVENLLEYDALNAIARTVIDVRVELDGAGLRLERPAGVWWVGDPAAREQTSVRAEPRLAEATLQRLLELEVARFLDPREGEQFDPIGEVVLTLEDGSLVAGDLGPLHTDEAGSGRLFRRRGEDLWGLLDDDLGELARSAPSDFESLTVVEVSELEQRLIEVVGPQASRAWERDPDRGLWSRRGESVEDRAFALAVEGLLNLRVDSWRPSHAASQLGDLHRVRIEGIGEASHEFELGRAVFDGEPSVVCLRDGRVGKVPGRVLDELERLLLR